MRCPVCDGEARFLFVRNGFEILGCTSCGHRFLATDLSETHVGQVYGDDYFTEGGAGYPGYLLQGDILRARGRYYSGLVERHSPPGRMLDVGAASGFILRGFMDQGWTGLGEEPNDTMAAFGRDVLHVPIETGPFEAFDSDETFDLVSMVQVLPHFYDLRRALKVAARVTRPGGLWFTEIWNRGSWTARILGRHWPEYSPPSVVRWFAPSDLALAARHAGFAPVASGRPRRWVQGAHAKSLLAAKFGHSGMIAGLGRGALSLIPDRLTLPYPSEDLYWAIFRKTGEPDFRP
jgi:SAM-dependent methyltransferase